MLPVFTFRWHPLSAWREPIPTSAVNAWVNMVKAHIPNARPIVITDDPAGIKCETYPLWEHPVISDVPKANCYVRLKAFSDEFEQAMRAEFQFEPNQQCLFLDLDCIIRESLADTIARHDNEDLVLGYGLFAKYNPSIMLYKLGTRPDIYDDFDPQTSPAITYQYVGDIDGIMDAIWWPYTLSSRSESAAKGSDMAWISHVAGNVPRFTPKDDKVWSFDHLKTLKGTVIGHGENEINGFRLEYEKARLVFFSGPNKAWDENFKHSFVKDEYRQYVD
jgi:hypothetical protein